jgi:phage terminase large subunit
MSVAWFPEKTRVLFHPTAEYVVLYGGRGSGKTTAVAQKLVLDSIQKKVRILCAREVQLSIAESSKQAIESAIKELGVEALFDVQRTTIINRVNGSQFLFRGLSSETSASLKSLEKIDITWVEEAQSITEHSWQILLPTVMRSPMSRCYITFNPELDTNPVYKRFVKTAPPNSLVVKCNYQDNEKFPDSLNRLRMHDFATLPREEYNNIWEGACRSAVVGAVYSAEIARLYESKRVQPVYYDPGLPVHCIWDLGFTDATAVIFVQRFGSELRIIDYYESNNNTYAQDSAAIRAKEYNIATMWLPHDGNHSNKFVGLTAKQTLESMGWHVEIVDDVDREVGIRTARELFSRIVADEVKCAELLEHLRRYRRKVTKDGTIGALAHDEASHAADAFRYLAIVAPQLTSSLVNVVVHQKIDYSNLYRRLR